MSTLRPLLWRTSHPLYEKHDYVYLDVRQVWGIVEIVTPGETVEMVPKAVWDRRRDTKVHDQQGHFVFPDVEPGLYLLECRIPYRARVSSRVPVEEVEYRDVCVDGSYDVTGRETIYRDGSRTVYAPGNSTIDVVEVLGDGKATAVTLSSVR